MEIWRKKIVEIWKKCEVWKQFGHLGNVWNFENLLKIWEKIRTLGKNSEMWNFKKKRKFGKEM